MPSSPKSSCLSSWPRAFSASRPCSSTISIRAPMSQRPCESIRPHRPGGPGRDLPHDAPRRAPDKEAAQNLFHNLFFTSDRYDLSALAHEVQPPARREPEIGSGVLYDGATSAGAMTLSLRHCTPSTARPPTSSTRSRCWWSCVMAEAPWTTSTTSEPPHPLRGRDGGESVPGRLVRVERRSRSACPWRSPRTHAQELINAKPCRRPSRSSSAPASSRSSWTRTTRSRRSPTSAASRRWVPGSGTGARGFEVRDVHPTHYGRVCPIETPEDRTSAHQLPGGLCAHQQVRLPRDPYRKVVDSRATLEIEYLSPSRRGTS